jgi:hypothetical protein
MSYLYTSNERVVHMIIYDIRRLSYFNYFSTDGKEITKEMTLLSTRARQR